MMAKIRALWTSKVDPRETLTVALEAEEVVVTTAATIVTMTDAITMPVVDAVVVVTMAMVVVSKRANLVKLACSTDRAIGTANQSMKMRGAK
jgi:hypothetical protein